MTIIVYGRQMTVVSTCFLLQKKNRIPVTIFYCAYVFVSILLAHGIIARISTHSFVYSIVFLCLYSILNTWGYRHIDAHMDWFSSIMCSVFISTHLPEIKSRSGYRNGFFQFNMGQENDRCYRPKYLFTASTRLLTCSFS